MWIRRNKFLTSLMKESCTFYHVLGDLVSLYYCLLYWEGYFHTIIYLVCSFLNLNIQAETSKHKGRLDLLAATKDFLYLMEFKLNDTAQNALTQIKSSQYALSYKNSPKRIFLVGIGFSKEERKIKRFYKSKK